MKDDREKRHSQLERALASGNWGKAEKALQELLQHSPQSLSLHLRAAEVAEKLGNREDAIRRFDHVAERTFQEGRYRQSLVANKRLLELSPEWESAKRRDSFLRIRLGLPISLAEHPISRTLFDRVAAADLDELSVEADVMVVPRGQAIVREEEEGFSLFIIHGGSVQVSIRDRHDHQVPLARLKTGEFFGEVSLLTGDLRTATVTADEETVLWVYTRSQIARLAKKYPHIVQILQNYCRNRLASTAQIIKNRKLELRGFPRVELTSPAQFQVVERSDAVDSPWLSATLMNLSKEGAFFRLDPSLEAEVGVLRKGDKVRLSFALPRGGDPTSLTAGVSRFVKVVEEGRRFFKMGVWFTALPENTVALDEVNQFVTNSLLYAKPKR